MCHIQINTHPCGCRDEGRLVNCDRAIYHRMIDSYCLQALVAPRRRRRYCSRHHPANYSSWGPHFDDGNGGGNGGRYFFPW